MRTQANSTRRGQRGVDCGRSPRAASAARVAGWLERAGGRGAAPDRTWPLQSPDGSELVISEKTVSHHVQHIYDKIDVSTRAAATLFAMRNNLIFE